MKIRRRTSRAEVPSLAMGDIAFNLLIFFVILAQGNDDSFLHWEPAEVKKIESAGESRASVVIDSRGKLFLNGGETSQAALADRISEALGDAEPGNRTVLLKVHNETQAERFEPVIEAISEAGGDMVHILEMERK